MCFVNSRLGLAGLLCAVIFSGCDMLPEDFQPDHGEIILVREGSPEVVLVTADNPSRVAAYAAEEMVIHVEKATGVALRVMVESEVPGDYVLSRIYIGETRAAERQGIDAASMPPDAYLLRTADRDLYVVGREEEGQLFGLSDRRGTLYGVYELLERYVGVRWLWPGNLGTFVPQAETVSISGNLDEITEPVFQFRQFRTWGINRAISDYDPDASWLTFSRSGLQSYADDLQVYLARQRVGFSYPKPIVGHYFQGWWERYGEEHPDWFMMRADGERGPGPDASAYRRTHVPMCVSNPDLHRYIVEEAWDGGDILRLGEADISGLCRCPDCLAWDEEVQQPDFARYELLVSDRYARFWATIRDMAREHNPDVLVTAFLYTNYFPAPVSDIDLEGIYGEFVPWGIQAIGYFPMEDEALEWLKAQWVGWSSRGMTMAYRPNYLLGGYVMPFLSTWQAGEMFQFAARRGMIGLDFDSLWGHWSVKGPMLYMHMRLAVDPEQDIAELRREYFSAYGPAAHMVERYFDYWEDYSHDEVNAIHYSDLSNAGELYPQEVFIPAREMLDEAMARVEDHPRAEFAERVEFLQAGLEHARLAANFVGKLGHRGALPVRDPEMVLKARQALEELIEFRRAHEHLYIADYAAASWQEHHRIDVEKLLRMDVEDIRSERLGAMLEEPWGQWHFRRDPEDHGLQNQWYDADIGETEKGLQYFDGTDPSYQIDSDYWMPVSVPSTLADTDIGPYLGFGWYAVVFTVPGHLEGRPMRMLFEAVDEQAWVYVNGVYAGEHTEESEGLGVGILWERPFTVEVDPEMINYGGENLLVVRTHASVGASGIWGPVHIYYEE